MSLSFGAPDRPIDHTHARKTSHTFGSIFGCMLGFPLSQRLEYRDFVVQSSTGATRARNSLIGLGAVLFVVACVGCRRSSPEKEKPAPSATSKPSAEVLKVPDPDGSADPDGPSGPATAATAVTKAPSLAGSARRTKSRGPARSTARFILDGPEMPIAMGGGATVYSKGILWRAFGNSAAVSTFGPNGPTDGPKEEERAKKWPHAKIAVAEDASGTMHSYWIEGRELIRHKITADGKLEGQEAVLHDAVPGSTPAALRSAGRDVVAYTANPGPRNAERHARLWVEGGGILDLSPEGSGASSVSLIPIGEGQVIAMWLDARAAMTPIHARRFEIREKTTAIAEDEVIFVGGPPDAFPEITGFRFGNAASGLVPLVTEKGFALHNILVNWQGKVKVGALEYPNGLDVAPVTGASACGEGIAVYSRPEAKEPNSPQVLEIATLGKNGSIDVEEVAAYPGNVHELSAAAIDETTVWVVYTANSKSFAMRIRCGGDQATDKPAGK